MVRRVATGLRLTEPADSSVAFEHIWTGSNSPIFRISGTGTGTGTGTIREIGQGHDERSAL